MQDHSETYHAIEGMIETFFNEHFKIIKDMNIGNKEKSYINIKNMEIKEFIDSLISHCIVLSSNLKDIGNNIEKIKQQYDYLKTDEHIEQLKKKYLR